MLSNSFLSLSSIQRNEGLSLRECWAQDLWTAPASRGHALYELVKPHRAWAATEGVRGERERERERERKPLDYREGTQHTSLSALLTLRSPRSHQPPSLLPVRKRQDTFRPPTPVF